MIQQNVNLKPYNTFGIEVYSAGFARFSTITELKTILESNPFSQLLILGGGSNLLLTKDYDGLVLKNEIQGFTILEDASENVIIEAGAGEIWHEFVMKCIENGYAGVENLSLIPGSVGASPMQNIGAYGVEIKDIFHHLKAYHIASGEIHTFDKEACNFGYRESVFKNIHKGQYIILSVAFELSKSPKINTTYGAIETELAAQNITEPTIRDVSNAVIAIRQSKLPDPKVLGNAGSFFKNPVVDEAVVHKIQENYPSVPNYPASEGKRKLAAGWLIEQAGWKGKTIETVFHAPLAEDAILYLILDQFGKNYLWILFY
jgi:UDP-N-acetylmuramate dehydrogenase